MTSAAKSARPPSAITCWCDHTNIYTEIPASNGGKPYIQSWPLTEGGLSRAIAQMKVLRDEHLITGDYRIPLNPLIRREAGILNVGADARARARKAIRNMLERL